MITFMRLLEEIMKILNKLIQLQLLAYLVMAFYRDVCREFCGVFYVCTLQKIKKK